MFFWENNKTKKMYQLEGGVIHNILNQDLMYYYNSIERFAESIKAMISDYNSKINKISQNVKMFGGSGKIHGCIVDIDFYSHLYLNPYDNKLIPYFATDIENKFVYDSVAGLLYNCNNDLYLKLQRIPNLYLRSDGADIMKKPKKETDTSIYKISKIIYSLQRTSNFNIVRLWDDRILNMKNINNKELLQMLIHKQKN